MDEVTEVEETRVLELFRSKWALSILLALSDGELRFDELKRAVGSAPSNSLSGCPTELEAEDFIIRTIGDGAPPHVSYALERATRVRTCPKEIRRRRVDNEHCAHEPEHNAVITAPIPKRKTA